MAQAATGDASTRLRVIAAAMRRLEADHAWAPASPGVVTLVVAGATSAEAGALAKSDFSATVGDRAVRLVLLGPELHGKGSEALAASASRLEVRALPGAAETALLALGDWRPDLVVCFMPGFWGYASWEAGSRALAGLGIPLVSTAYTLEEAEDDEDALLGFLSGASLLWEAEATPEGVRAEAQFGTCPATGRALVENAAWLCVAGAAKD